MSTLAVILVGLQHKGTRFRPLSLYSPKFCFPLLGKSLLEHQIDKLLEIKHITTILLAGTTDKSFDVDSILNKYSNITRTQIRFVDEINPAGTAGCLHNLSHEVMSGGFDRVIVCHSDVVCNYPFKTMLEKLDSLPVDSCRILTIEMPQSMANELGRCVADDSSLLLHYVEKSNNSCYPLINCGVYVFSPTFFTILDEIYLERSQKETKRFDLGLHVFPVLINKKILYSFNLNNPWCSIKTPTSALLANEIMLSVYLSNNNNYGCEIISPVYIHPSARIDESAKIGPNVSIGNNVQIGPGVRIRRSIILDNCEIKNNSFVSNSIIGWNSYLEPWTRVEGNLPPNFNDFLTSNGDNDSYFSEDGGLKNFATVLGNDVKVSMGCMLNNTIVLPYKEITSDISREIIL